jgi:hypothetical protein
MGTLPGRGRIEALLVMAAVLVVAAMVAVAVWVIPLTTSGVGAEDVPKAGAGSAIVHDDAGNVNPGAVSAVVHDDAGNMPATGGASAVIHDDAGNLKPR